MRKLFCFVIVVIVALSAGAQVKIGHSPADVNPGAVLELSNNLSGPANTWKSFIPPTVDFSNAAFTSHTVWGLAGSPVAGAIVYNSGDIFTKGFSGAGLYCWFRNAWTVFTMTPPDKIRASLSTSVAAYDAAAANSWVNVTATEYNNLITVVSGAAKYGASDGLMTTSTTNGWDVNYTAGGNTAYAKVPASNFIIAWSVRTGLTSTAATGSKLKVSTVQNAGYTDYGNPLPNIGSIAANTRVYFVLKAPAYPVPAAPSYTAVYNNTVYFLGNTTTGGPESYAAGDMSALGDSNAAAAVVVLAASPGHKVAAPSVIFMGPFEKEIIVIHVYITALL